MRYLLAFLLLAVSVNAQFTNNLDYIKSKSISVTNNGHITILNAATITIDGIPIGGGSGGSGVVNPWTNSFSAGWFNLTNVGTINGQALLFTNIAAIGGMLALGTGNAQIGEVTAGVSYDFLRLADNTLWKFDSNGSLTYNNSAIDNAQFSNGAGYMTGTQNSNSFALISSIPSLSGYMTGAQSSNSFWTLFQQGVFSNFAIASFYPLTGNPSGFDVTAAAVAREKLKSDSNQVSTINFPGGSLNLTSGLPVIATIPGDVTKANSNSTVTVVQTNSSGVAITNTFVVGMANPTLILPTIPAGGSTTGILTNFLGGAALTYTGTNIVTDCTSNNVFFLTLTNNAILNIPTNTYDGSLVTWRFKQDGTGNRVLTLAGGFTNAANHITVTLTTNANAYDSLTVESFGNTNYHVRSFDYNY